jgi:hypothetical protein
LRRQLFATVIAFFSCIPAFADDKFTSPQTIVNVAITPTANGNELIFTGAQIYFETVQSSYHVESQRDRPDLANRTQDVNILQSKLLRFGVRQLNFRTIAGDELDIEDVKTRLQKNPLALMMPVGASIHPQLAATMNPGTVVVTRVEGRSKLQHLVPRPDSE